MKRKAAYPLCLLILTVILCGFSLLEKQLLFIQTTAFVGWPMLANLIGYFIFGGLLIFTFSVKRKSESAQIELEIANLAFGILNVCLYFLNMIYSMWLSDSVLLIFAGFLIFSAPLKMKETD